jgi:hypothetical protein
MKTAMPKYGLVVWALVFFGCIGLERAYDECVSSGRCHASDAGEADAGNSDVGRPDAGTSPDGGGAPDAGAGPTDAGLPDSGPGQDTGTPDSGPGPGDGGPPDTGPGPGDGGPPDTGPVPYDGGPPCGQSTHPKLRCDAPIELGTGSKINWSALSATTDGFIAAWVGATAEVREVHLDGSMRTLVTGVPVNEAQIVVDAKGSRWAAAWSDANATAATCITSASDAGVQVGVNDGGVIGVLNVATSAAGAIALTAATTSRRFMGAHSSAGCPANLPALIGDSINSGGVVSTSASGGDGFRYVWTDQINAYNGSISMLSREADGGTTIVAAAMNFHAPEGVAVVASTSGATVLTAFSQFNTSDTYDLGLYGTSADLSGDGAPATASSVNPGWWCMGTCGQGCVMTGLIGSDVPGPAIISFYSDDPEIRPRGTWDAVCSLQPQNISGSSISVASFGGRLGVILTTASAAKLYLCDMPPLP